jgi:N-acetylneuraminic acid mutarotase
MMSAVRRHPELRALLLGLVVLSLVAGCIGLRTDSAAPVDQTSPGHWTHLMPMPTSRQEVATATLGDRLVVIGGFGESAEPVDTVEAYDPETNGWEPLAAYPVAVHHAAAVTVGDRLFVMGGYTGGRLRWTALDDVYEYVPARNRWEARASMTTARGALAAAVLDGRVHTLGGAVGSALNTHEVYDPATNRWTRANAMPTARDHLAAVAFGGRVWAIGGRTSFFGTQYANVEVYDPATDSWQTGPPLPTGRGGLGAVAFHDRILVFGGETPTRIFNATEMYEVAGNRWIAKEPMPTPRHGIGVAVLGDRVHVVGGGTRPGFAATPAHEVFGP